MGILQFVNFKFCIQVKNTIGVPVVKLQQQHKKFLGIPYSTCIDKNHSSNSFYTRETCREYCIAQSIITECQCRLGWWPAEFNMSTFRICTIKDHIYCINDLDRGRSSSACSCPIECNKVSYNKNILFDGVHEHNIEQLKTLSKFTGGKCLGKIRFNLYLSLGKQAFSGLNVATVMVELDDESEYELVEKPDITSTQVY